MNRFLENEYQKNRGKIKTILPQSAILKACSDVKGSSDYPLLHGHVQFFSYRKGTLITGEFWGLPYSEESCASNLCALHIHEQGDCNDTHIQHFEGSKGHYNPTNCPHPTHAGDLPPLFSNEGYAWFSFYTDRFQVPEVIGRSVIVHSQADDFTTQPTGNSGDRIACGTIYSTLKEE